MLQFCIILRLMYMELLQYLFIFIFGTFIGSFLGVVIDRLPRGENIVRGRSHCDHCKKSLGAFDLIPLVSFLLLRGRCRYCGTKLSLFYPIIEVVTGFLFVLIATVNNLQLTIDFFFQLFIVSVLIVIFFIDLKHGIIPFSLVAFGTLITFVYLILTTNYLILGNVVAGLGAFGFFLFLFLATRGRGMGFGDVVYAFFMGFLLGSPKIIVGLYIAFVSGALAALVLVWLKRKKMQGGTIPFGPFLVFGTLIALFWGETIINLFMRYVMY